ncbi:MAG TPA: hypothetical protein VJG83_04475 [archaeon]|nr:hypothetical protein [archaeon]
MVNPIRAIANVWKRYKQRRAENKKFYENVSQAGREKSKRNLHESRRGVLRGLITRGKKKQEDKK